MCSGERGGWIRIRKMTSVVQNDEGRGQRT